MDLSDELLSIDYREIEMRILSDLSPQEESAWLMYCMETEGDADVRDFWHELPPCVQQLYLDRVAK